MSDFGKGVVVGIASLTFMVAACIGCAWLCQAAFESHDAAVLVSGVLGVPIGVISALGSFAWYREWTDQ